MEYSRNTYLEAQRNRLNSYIENELRALADFVRAGIIPLESIKSIPLRNLNELTIRAQVIRDSAGSYTIVFPHNFPPKDPVLKVQTIVGLTPDHKRAYVNNYLLEQAAVESILEYNTRISSKKGRSVGSDNPATVEAIVFTGSFFQEGKTPNIYSDLDCEVLTREKYMSSGMKLLVRILRRQLKNYGIKMPVEAYSRNIHWYRRVMEDEARISLKTAVPYRSRDASFHAEPGSLLVTPYESDAHSQLRDLISHATYLHSEYPCDPLKPPSAEVVNELGISLSSRVLHDGIARMLAES